MKRQSPSEIVQHLETVKNEQNRGMSLKDASRKIGVTAQTIVRWKKEYGKPRDHSARMRELEIENARLKRVVTDLAINNAILKEVLSGSREGST